MATITQTTCYILQKPLLPREKEIYTTEDIKDPEPETVLLLIEDEDNPASKLRDQSPDHIISQSGKYTLAGDHRTPYFWGKKLDNGQVVPSEFLHSGSPNYGQQPFGLKVPGDIVAASGIANGDKVTIHINHAERLVTIVTVNGESDLARVKSWPRILDLDAGYPTELIPLGQFSYILRALELLAPVGFGQSGYVLGPGGSGKTYAILEVVRALLELLKIMPELHVICIYVGDRAKDVKLYRKVMQTALDHNRAEFYIGEKRIPSVNQYAMFRYALERGADLCRKPGRKVVVTIDSTSRAVHAHSFGGYADPEGGMISGGIYLESLGQVARDISGTGYFEETGSSLTIFNTVLYSDERGASALVQFARETKDNEPDCTWTFLNNPSLGEDNHPWVSIHERETWTRKPPGWITKHFVPDALQEDIDEVRERMGWPINNRSPTAKEMHRRLIQYAREDKRIPSYVNQLKVR